MSGRERKRLLVLSQVGAGELRLQAAAELLGVSYRQMKRLWSRYQAEGDSGLVHGPLAATAKFRTSPLPADSSCAATGSDCPCPKRQKPMVCSFKSRGR